MKTWVTERSENPPIPEARGSQTVPLDTFEHHEAQFGEAWGSPVQPHLDLPKAMGVVFPSPPDGFLRPAEAV